MKQFVFAFASLALACSSTTDEIVQPADTGGAEVCTPFDAGPKGTPPVLPDSMDGDDAAATDSATDTGPIVTKAQVDEIFKFGCSISSCHGSKPGKGNLYIEPPPGNWYTNVVNVPSKTLPSMKLIVPYDPQNSFLVQKLTDGICALNSQCVDKNCGERMPQANDPLEPADRDTIIEWVRQGAKE
jgi:hypothetical protein